MRQRTLIVMVKEPRAGRVKTRLGRSIGMTSAAWWYRHQMRRSLRDISDPRWTTVLAVAPDVATAASRVFPTQFPRIPQGGGDLGVRMARCLSLTPGPSVLVGSDIPGMSRTHIADAFAALGRAPSVVGPATDGGFWLIGLRHPRHPPAGMFAPVRWSHPKTLRDTLPTLPQPVARVATLSDVDDVTDLKRE